MSNLSKAKQKALQELVDDYKQSIETYLERISSNGSMKQPPPSQKVTGDSLLLRMLYLAIRSWNTERIIEIGLPLL